MNLKSDKHPGSGYIPITRPLPDLEYENQMKEKSFIKSKLSPKKQNTNTWMTDISKYFSKENTKNKKPKIKNQPKKPAKTQPSKIKKKNKKSN